VNNANRNFIYPLILCLLLGVKNLNAQETYRDPGGLNNWYVELGGSALFYSLNYEKYLYKSNSERLTVVGRVGAAYNPGDYKFLNLTFIDRSSFIFPFTSTLFWGSGKEKLEFGGGFAMLTKNFKEREVVPCIVAGLRVIETNRVCFRISYTPYLRDGNFNSWFGVSLGKNFNFK